MTEEKSQFMERAKRNFLEFFEKKFVAGDVKHKNDFYKINPLKEMRDEIMDFWSYFQRVCDIVIELENRNAQLESENKKLKEKLLDMGL